MRLPRDSSRSRVNQNRRFLHANLHPLRPGMFQSWGLIQIHSRILIAPQRGTVLFTRRRIAGRARQPCMPLMSLDRCNLARVPVTPLEWYWRALTLVSPARRNRSPKPGSHFNPELRSTY